MYSMVLMMAMTGSGDVVAHGNKGCSGCCGYAVQSSGCCGGKHGGGLFGGLFNRGSKHGCSGCSGYGCSGYGCNGAAVGCTGCSGYAAPVAPPVPAPAPAPAKDMPKPMKT